MNPPSLKYRKEVDGLRAVAVIPVVLYHAGFPLFSGGYVGVDIFFVISGYLITSIILKERAAGTFSLRGFYERRARRILPALFFIMACCVPAAFILMTPTSYEDFSRSLIAVVFFVSNFFFWRESGYFSPAAEDIPMLHTWSLAVEEQYYLAFPLLLLALWRFGKINMVLAIAAIAGLSLIFAEWISRSDANAGFYLTHARVWEIFAGALCAFATISSGRAIKNLASAAGVLLILASVFLFHENTPFPSLYTLIPVTGSVLFILFADGDTYAGRLMSLKLFVGIGLISYSIYLWHQPLFAFVRISTPGEPGLAQMGLLSVLTAAPAYLTWKYVECPFRRRGTANSISTKMMAVIFSSTAVLMAGFSAAGISLSIQERYFLRDFQDNSAKLYNLVERHTQYDLYDVMGDDGECRFWVREVTQLPLARFNACKKKHQQAVIVLGDSHAMNIHNFFFRAGMGDFLIGVSQGGCRPHRDRPKCKYKEFREFAASEKNSIRRIYFHQSGSYFLQDDQGKNDTIRIFQEQSPFAFDRNNFDKTVTYLNDLSLDNEVIWLGPFVEARFDYESALKNPETEWKINRRHIDLFDRLEGEMLKLLENQGQNVEYISLINTLDINPQSLLVGDCLTYRDGDHFSICGEEIFGERLRQQLQAMRYETAK
ncbi:acyltransferase family protein [Hyphococcus sp.]|uniref:acyltransferase family protein n=1 Tax=Hyphococcus sp. TaxID=2038636 RepID=UPI003CCB87EB